MKFVASLFLSSAVVQAAHLCASANVVMNAMPNASEFNDTDVSIEPFFDGNSTQKMYRDRYFKYTATCNGVGLVIVEGNNNLTWTAVDVWSGGCGAPVLKKVSSTSSAYTDADMAAVTLSFNKGGARLQYIATNETEYIIRVGTSNDNNNTGEFGNFMFSLTAACVTPASNDPVNPTMVMGNMTYYNSNVNGTVTPNNCGKGNNVYFGYTAECTGDISFNMPSNGGRDGFQGEDLRIGVYNYSLTAFSTSTGPDVCQDDPAIISVFRNTSEIPAGIGKLQGGIVKDKKYLIQVSSYDTDKCPFVLKIDGPFCVQEPASTSSAAALALSGFAAAMMLSM